LGNYHACGGIINWQGQTKPMFRQVSHVPEARLTSMELARSPGCVWSTDRRWQRMKNDYRDQDETEEHEQRCGTSQAEYVDD